MRSSEFGIARKVSFGMRKYSAEFTPIYNSIEKSDLKRPLRLFVVLAFEYISPFSFEGKYYKYRKD